MPADSINLHTLVHVEYYTVDAAHPMMQESTELYSLIVRIHMNNSVHSTPQTTERDREQKEE